MTESPVIGSKPITISHQKHSRLRSYIQAVFYNDIFIPVTVGLTLSSIILTISLIIDSNVGKAAIPPHGAVFSSDKRCSEHGINYLNNNPNTYYAAVVTSLCMLSTTPGIVSFGSGGIATVYNIGEANTTYLNFTGRTEHGSLPSFMAGLLKLKEEGDKLQESKTNLNETSGELQLEKETWANLMKYTKGRLDATRDNNLINMFNHLAEDPYSFYDEKGKFYTQLKQKNTFDNSKLLNLNEKIQFKPTKTVSLTNGALDSVNYLPLLTLGAIDEYLVVDDEHIEPTSSIFPCIIASSMYEAGRIYMSPKNKLNLTKESKEAAKNMRNEKLAIRPRADDVNPDFFLPNLRKAVYLSVIGNDDHVISIVFTAGKQCIAMTDLEISSNEKTQFCSSDFEDVDMDRIPAPIIFRPKCGVCGKHTIITGGLPGVINFAAHTIRFASLKDATFVERVTVDNGTVLFEAGMPSQEPEKYKALKVNQNLKSMEKEVGIDWAGAIEWYNDEVHAISDGRDSNTWPAYAF